MRLLQLLIGGLYDKQSSGSEDHRFLSSVSFACFGIFPNVATILILFAAGIRHFFHVEHLLIKFTGSKLLWLGVMIVIFVLVTGMRSMILAPDRARFLSEGASTVFLILYYGLTFISLIGAYWVYGQT